MVSGVGEVGGGRWSLDALEALKPGWLTAMSFGGPQSWPGKSPDATRESLKIEECVRRRWMGS